MLMGMGTGIGIGSGAPRRHTMMLRRRIIIAGAGALLIFLASWQAAIRIKTASVKIVPPAPTERQ
ncbi:MAG: hypothetical protein LBH41_01975 [Rickettsiales bacterium]|jgi:hypothetical protein|nr:hypothetical protein [Rickettsiales bacterium]